MPDDPSSLGRRASLKLNVGKRFRCIHRDIDCNVDGKLRWVRDQGSEVFKSENAASGLNTKG